MLSVKIVALVTFLCFYLSFFPFLRASHVEAPARLAILDASRHGQAWSARLLQDHQAPHGHEHHQEAVGEQLLLGRPGVH